MFFASSFFFPTLKGKTGVDVALLHRLAEKLNFGKRVCQMDSPVVSLP